ncbi:MAG: hypothetical protein ACRELD_13560, partial [Longimicrobiales bacterium]
SKPAAGAGPAASPTTATAEPVERRFTNRGTVWIAHVMGACAYGTGTPGTAPLVQLGFRPEHADLPTHAALTAPRDLRSLYDEELCALLSRATPIAADAAGGT